MSKKVKVDSLDMLVAADVSNPGFVTPPGTGMPTGGATDAILHKKSGTDFDIQWLAKATTVADLTDSTGSAATATIPQVRSDTLAHAASDANDGLHVLNTQVKAITDALKAAKLMA